MENLTDFLNRKRKLRKSRSIEKKNGPVIQIAMSIDRNPKPITRKILNMPERKLNIEYYTPIEVPYLDKNGDEKVSLEPGFKDLTRNAQKREQKRLLPKHYDQEALYRIYGE